MALKIFKSIHLFQTSLTAEVGSGVGAVGIFMSCLLSFGNIKFYSHLKMHLIAFTSDTSPFFPSYNVTAISQQAAEKKMYERLLVHRQALLCWSGSAIKGLIADRRPAELHMLNMVLISCAFPPDSLAAVPA